MASIVSKLARAAFSTRAFPLASKGRAAAAIRASPPGSPKSEVEEEDARPRGYDGHLAVDENALKSDEAMWAFYERWCKYHGISRDRREMQRRFKKFSERARLVHKVNSASDGSVEFSMTRWADLTTKEVSCQFGGLRPRRK